MKNYYFNHKQIGSYMATRYHVLSECIRVCKPQTIVEIGVHRGDRMEQMIRAARQYQEDIMYWGYDLWELLPNPELVGHGKGPSSRWQCEQRLRALEWELKFLPSTRTQLRQGDIDDTLPRGVEVDLVFIDADHRKESIQRDYKRVKDSQVIVLDDWYRPQHLTLGCNDIKHDKKYSLITSSNDACNLTGVEGIECLIVTDLKQVRDHLLTQGCVEL